MRVSSEVERVFIMKRVLLTVHKFFPAHRAGTEVLTLKVAQELKQRGYQVSVVTADPPDTDARRKSVSQNSGELVVYEYEGISVYCLNESARLHDNRFSNEHYHPYLKKHFRNIFETVSPDIVHCFHLQNLSTSLLEEAYDRRIPVIYSATDFWLICPIVQLRRPDGSNCLGTAPFGANCLSCYTPELMPEQAEFEEALSTKYPQLLEKNVKAGFPQAIASATYFAYIAKKLPSAIQATMVRANVLKSFANRLSAITVPTVLMQDLFVRNGLNSQIIHRVPYGIDTKPLEKGRNKTPSDELRIAFIGTISEHKGPDLLVKAFLQLPPDSKASLTIYGDLNQFPDFGKQLTEIVSSSSDSRQAEKIRFAGTFPNDQIGGIFQEIDVLVVPSRWYENTPLVIQSALAAKTPVIATNLGGMSEIIKHETNGLLFEVDSIKSLQEQLMRLINQPELLASLRRNIEPERSVAEMVDALELIYRKIHKVEPLK